MAERTVFSTQGLAAPERFQAWRDSIGVVFDVDPARAKDPDNLSAEVESWMLDGVMFSRCRTGAQAFSRPVSKIVADGLDHYMVQLFLDGGVEMRRGERAISTAPGAIIGFDMADVLDSANSDFDLLNLFIPRRLLAPLLDAPDSFHGGVVDPASGAGLLLAEFMQGIYGAANRLTTAEAAAAAEALVRSVAAAFNRTPLRNDDPPGWADCAVMMKARRFISDHLAEETLSPGAVAVGIGVSRARLYRAAAEVGGIHELIWEMRLRRCLTDLTSPRYAGWQVATIGYRWGFKTPSHFARLFKRRFGVTPTQARDRGLFGLFRNGGGRLGPDRTYESWIATIA